MPSRDLAVRDQPGAAQPSRALQARARADLARRTSGNAPAVVPESAAQVRQRARAQRAQGALAPVAKVYGTAIPADIAAAEAASGMDSTTPFSPGAPLSPYDGFGRTPRSQNFVPQVNVTTKPRTHERVSFGTLKGLIDAYDIASMAIWHRIDSLRSLEWSLVAADGHEGDITSSLATGMAVLAKPDGQTPFGAWLAEYAYDVLAYDAGTLWRMRNRADQTVGLRVVDGSLIAPLLDDWGNTPAAPAPAYVQYINGLPWNWLTTNDLIYRPFRKRPDSPYGRPPLESVLLNANTDLRFQAYFLQRFTEGNLPAAFASAPESWTPQQIESFQEYWDGFILGDQTFKSQIRWIPPGSKIEWSNEKDFTDEFSLFMMRKTLAAYHVVPSDMGITDTVNKSTGETQADVQHRIGDVPLAKHISDILTAFLQDDLRLPLKFQFDFGEEQDDRLQLAQADQIYIQNAVVSPSEIRELRFGLGEPDGRPVPRYIFSTRSGAVPLDAVFAVAGEIDPESAAPAPGAPLPHKPFAPIAGVEPNPVPPTKPLAVQIYGDLTPPAPNPQVGIAPAPHSPMPSVDEPVTKDGEGAGAPTAGMTAATGITSYDLIGRRDDDEDDEEPTAVAKELTAYRRFAKARRRDGKWRDFQFETLDAATARSLNEAGRHSVMAKQAGVPGLTKHSGMISLDLPAGLVPTVPGGVDDHHITIVYLGKELSDQDFDAACDRAEAAAAQAGGPLVGTIAGIDSFPPSAGSDGMVPAFVPVTLPGVDQIRAALKDLSASEHTDYHPHVTLAYLNEGDPLPDPVPPTLVAFTHLSVHCGDETRSFPLGPQSLDVAKAASGGGRAPKGSASAKEAAKRWPAWDHDLDVADYWAPKITAAATGALTRTRAETLAREFTAHHPPTAGHKPDKAEKEALAAVALAYLVAQGVSFTEPFQSVLAALHTDAYLIGAASAQALTDGTPMQLGGWTPGNTSKAETQIERLGITAGLALLLAEAAGIAGDMSSTRLAALAAALAAGALAGSSPAVIGAALLAVLSAGWRAITAAFTETTNASSSAAMDIYRANSVELGQWELDPSLNNCAICVTNSEAGPVPIGQPYPSGHVKPSIHVKCGCSIAPAVRR